jgi:hypothetical protein
MNVVRLISGVLLTAALASSVGAQQPAKPEGLATLEAITSRSTEGLTFEHRSDGTISVDLRGRFQNVLMATTGKDGTLEVVCSNADHHHAAATPIVPWTPVRTGTLNRLQVPRRLAAPIRVAPATRSAAPEVK